MFNLISANGLLIRPVVFASAGGFYLSPRVSIVSLAFLALAVYRLVSRRRRYRGRRR